MGDNVKVPVDVETRDAKAKMAQLARRKAASKKRIVSAGRKVSRASMRAFAFTGAAATMGKFKNDAPSGNVDMFEEAMSPLYAKRDQLIDRELGYSAKARRAAREEAAATYAYYNGRTGDAGPMMDFYNAVSRVRHDIESGRQLVRQDPRFIGPDLETVAGAAAVGTMELFWKNLEASSPVRGLVNSIDYFVEGLLAD